MKYLLSSCLVAAVISFNSYNLSTAYPAYPVVIKDTIPENNDATKNETLGGKWQLQPVLSSDTAAGRIPTLNFDLSTNKVSGNTGCNTFKGGFIEKNGGLSFEKNMILTKMACPGYNEKIFLENLLKTNRFEIKKGVLELMYNTTVLSNWVRHADTSTTKQI